MSDFRNYDELITAAAVFAAEAHASQRRKELNEPYIVHPLRVGKLAAMLAQEFIAACYLHDVVEDTNIPLATVASLFPAYTTQLVEAMTKWWADGQDSHVLMQANKTAYYQKIMDTDGAVLLKVLDRVDNLYDFMRMARMSPRAHKWAKRYHAKTITEFTPLLVELPKHCLTPDTAEQALKMFTAAMSALEVSL